MKLFGFLLRVLQSALVLCGVGFAAPNQPIEPRVTLEINEGFCADGSEVPLVPSPGDPPKLNFWGGYCHLEQKKTALAKTSSFSAPPYLRIYMIGWDASPTLALERMSDGTKFLLMPWDQDMRRWSRCDYALPADWQGTQVRLVAEGASPGGLWRAFSEPLEGSGKVPMGDAVNILALTGLHFFGFMVCALALTAVAVLRGVRDTIQAGLITLAGTAVPGYCIFWLSLLLPHFSRWVAVSAFVAAIIGLVFCLRKLDNDGRAVLKSLLTPLFLTGATALLVLSSGFLYGGMQDPINKARCRFLPRLPPDNLLPLLVAAGARSPHMPTPLLGDWLSSDRPPLQSGIVLAHFPLFRRPREQSYTVVSVLAQSLWIFGLWLLLRAYRLNSRAVALVLAACLFSGFVFLNSLFVWPKLLAAAYTLGFLAAFVAVRPKEDSPLLWWIVPGALLSFSLLSHGGAMFFLITATPLVLLFSRPWQFKRMLTVVLFAFLLYSPWIAYQEFYDPPGNRLLKIHLAGVEPLDGRSLLQTLMDSYGSLTLGQITSHKAQNLELAFGEGFQGLQRTGLLVKELVAPGGLPRAAARGFQLREQSFFHPAVCLGFFILAPCALLAGIAKRFRSVEWRTACVLWVFTGIALIGWCLLMFGPYTTSIHQGAYATMLLAMAASVLSLWALSPRLALIVCLMQMGVNFLLWELLIRVPYPNGILQEGMIHADTLVLLCCSLTSVLWLLGRLARREQYVQSADANATKPREVLLSQMNSGQR
jgi:hypothetical protein